MAWDAQLEDDARLVVALARTAALHGAKVVTRCAAEEVSRSGARVRDELTGARFDVCARSVVNAAGVWAGERKRWVFAIGQRNGLALVGLTDMAVSGPLPEVPQPLAEDIPFLLETISGALARPLAREDVVGSFAGLRPLVDGASGVPSAGLSRRHAVVRHGAQAPAVLALAGGDTALLAPVAPGLDVLLVEVLHAMHSEGALDADDVLDRRTRIGLVPADRARAEATVGELVEAAPRAAAA